MNRNINRLCILMAASNFSFKELENFIFELKNTDAAILINTIRLARQSIENLPITSHNSSEESRLHSDGVSGAIKKISRLLIDEAGLPKHFAMQLISDELLRRNPRAKIPLDPKKGFEIWLSRLQSNCSESELLHIATLIRNKYVHTDQADWRLK